MTPKVINTEITGTKNVIEFPMNDRVYTAKVYSGAWGVDVDWFVGQDFIEINDRWKVLPTELYDLNDDDWDEILLQSN